MTASTFTPHIYTVGQNLGVTPPAEGYMPLLQSGGFDIVAFLSGIGPREVKDWHRGKAGYGVFIEKSIPFVLFNLGKLWTFEIYFNILLESREKRQNFFEGDPNRLGVHLYLVSFPKAVVQAVRRIDIHSQEMMRIKEACFDQISTYPSKDECLVEAEFIFSRHNAKSLRKQTTMHAL